MNYPLFGNACFYRLFTDRLLPLHYCNAPLKQIARLALHNVQYTKNTQLPVSVYVTSCLSIDKVCHTTKGHIHFPVHSTASQNFLLKKSIDRMNVEYRISSFILSDSYCQSDFFKKKYWSYKCWVQNKFL